MSRSSAEKVRTPESSWARRWILGVAVIGALAPFLANSRPYFVDDPVRGRVFPLFAALTIEDKLWLAIVLGPIVAKLSQIVAAPIGRWWSDAARRRCANGLLGAFLLVALIVGSVTKTIVDPHAYRRERDIRSALAEIDGRLVADPTGPRAAKFHAEATELRRDAAALADLQSEIGERITIISDALSSNPIATSAPAQRLDGPVLERIADLAKKNSARSSILASAVFAPLPVGAVELDRRVVSLPPFRSAAHPLGTDHRGRDLLAILVHGTRTSMTIGVFSVALALLVGIAAGALAGLGPKWLDAIVSLAIKAMMALPVLSILLVLVAYVPPSRSTMIFVLALLLWPSIARLVRSEVARLAGEEFVLAVRALGAGPLRVFFRHLLPNLKTPLFVHAALAVGSVVLAESTLDFLGLAAPDAVGWGGMIAASRRSPGELWHFAVFPGAMLVGLVIALNVVGRRRSDPSMTLVER